MVLFCNLLSFHISNEEAKNGARWPQSGGKAFAAVAMTAISAVVAPSAPPVWCTGVVAITTKEPLLKGKAQNS
jgi:hypothetical protein